MSSNYVVIKSISLSDIMKEEPGLDEQESKVHRISSPASSSSGWVKVKEEPEEQAVVSDGKNKAEKVELPSVEFIKKEEELIIDERPKRTSDSKCSSKNLGKRPKLKTIKSDSTVIEESLPPEEPEKPIDQPPKPSTLACIFCEEKFNRNDLLVAHYCTHKTVERMKCRSCDRIVCVNPQDILKNYKMREFKCLNCFGTSSGCVSRETQSVTTGKVRKKVTPMRAVTKTTVAKPKLAIKCDVCDTEVSSNIKLFWHMKAHLESKQFRCPVCRDDFASREAMIDHCKAVHSKTNRVLCEVCKQEFYNVDLTTHMKTHFDAEPTRHEPQTSEPSKYYIIQTIKVKLPHTNQETTITQKVPAVQCMECMEMVACKHFGVHRHAHTMEKRSKLIEKLKRRKAS